MAGKQCTEPQAWWLEQEAESSHPPWQAGRESKMEADGTFSSHSNLFLPSRPHLLNLNLL